MFDVPKAQRKGDRLMKKTSTVQALKSKLFKEQHLLKREHPLSTEQRSLTKECGWKDGDRGGLAE
jgi:hypothetical protein